LACGSELHRRALGTDSSHRRGPVSGVRDVVGDL
jgi:hypothetical protein